MVIFLTILVFTVFVPGTVAGYPPWSVVRNAAVVVTPWVYPAGLCFAVGAAIYLRCACDFGVAGRGTSAPIDAPKHLVVRGLYQYIRNPMYVGVPTVLAGWTMLYRNETLLYYSAAVFIAFYLFVVFYEELQLQQQFGDDFSAYRSNVGRWTPRYKGNVRS